MEMFWYYSCMDVLDWKNILYCIILKGCGYRDLSNPVLHNLPLLTDTNIQKIF